MKNSRLQELRFIVTQECTHGCIFCHGEGFYSKKKELLFADDINFIFNVGRLYFGFEHTTLTGGEPLMRRDIVEIAEKIKRNFGKVTLTTNGLLLKEKIYIGNYLERLNISIHSLDEREYEKISRRKKVFHKIIYGLEQFRSRFSNVKIRFNVTLVKEINSNEKNINELINFASRLNASIKFIEFYPSESKLFVPLDEIEKVILRKGFKSIVSMTRKKNYHNGVIEIGLTKIFCALISQNNDSSFCSDNNDLSQQNEQTINLTKDEFEELLKVGGKKVRKIRHYFKYKGREIEIDVFKDDLFGLVLVDVEFNSVEEKNKFQIPDFCLVEVTQEDFLAGGMLCGKTYQEIEENLIKFGYRKLE